MNYINVNDQEKVLTTLGQALEGGLSQTAKEAIEGNVSVVWDQMEKTSLGTLLQSSASPIALEVNYGTGIKGSTLVLMNQEDLLRIGPLFTAARDDDKSAEKEQDAWIRFLTDALEAANQQFLQDRNQSIACEPPSTINPDGGSEILQQKADAYEDAVCLRFQISGESISACQLHVVVHPELAASLSVLLPNFVLQETLEPGGEVQTWHPEGSQSDKTTDGMPSRPQDWNVNLILDVELGVVVSFGQTEMQMKDVLKLGVGSIIELDRGVNDPVTVVVNDKTIARGEVVMVDGNYGVKILDVESTADRIRSLG